MRFEIEKRLHRVKIQLDDINPKCPKSKICVDAEYCNRCNIFYEKCSNFKKLE